MLNQLDKMDLETINELEKTFSDVFSGHSITDNFLTNPFTHYIIYRADNQIVGFLNYDLIYDRIEIININVVSKYQKQGIATQMMTKLMDIAVSSSVGNITLEVACTNDKALGLYQKFDFKQIAIRPLYYDKSDAYLMEKEMK